MTKEERAMLSARAAAARLERKKSLPRAVLQTGGVAVYLREGDLDIEIAISGDHGRYFVEADAETLAAFTLAMCARINWRMRELNVNIEAINGSLAQGIRLDAAAGKGKEDNR